MKEQEVEQQELKKLREEIEQMKRETELKLREEIERVKEREDIELKFREEVEQMRRERETVLQGNEEEFPAQELKKVGALLKVGIDSLPPRLKKNKFSKNARS